MFVHMFRPGTEPGLGLPPFQALGRVPAKKYIECTYYIICSFTLLLYFIDTFQKTSILTYEFPRVC